MLFLYLLFKSGFNFERYFHEQTEVFYLQNQHSNSDCAVHCASLLAVCLSLLYCGRFGQLVKCQISTFVLARRYILSLWTD